VSSARRVRVGLAQLAVLNNKTEGNLARAEQLVKQAASDGCQLVVLPEAFVTGLNLPNCRKIATSVPGPLTSWLSTLAASQQVWLAAGVLEQDAESIYSSAVLIDGEGQLVDVYRRSVIYDLESHFIASGSGCRVVDSPIGRIGLVLGYDIQFPEVLRGMFAERVEIVICPAILLRQFTQSVRRILLARAAENCCYVLFCSATGRNASAGLGYMGHSAVVQNTMGLGAHGRDFVTQQAVLAETDDEEGVIVADLNLHELRRLQAATPFADDFLRTELSRVLVSVANARSQEVAR
jgi:deaminated glutathione amidase